MIASNYLQIGVYHKEERAGSNIYALETVPCVLLGKIKIQRTRKQKVKRNKRARNQVVNFSHNKIFRLLTLCISKSLSATSPNREGARLSTRYNSLIS